MPRYTRKIIIFAVFFVLVAAKSLLAAFPQPTGYVNDFANVLDSETKNYLEATTRAFEKESGNEIAVATVTSLDDAPIEDYAVRLYEKWGIGKKGKDNGVLILVAPNERKMRIEVGYGLEGIINDAKAGRIIREKMIPYFKEGNFSAGVLNGTLTTIALIAKGQNINFDFKTAGAIPVYNSPAKTKKGPLNKIFSVLFLIFMGYLFIRHPWLFLFFLASRGGGVGQGSRSGGFSSGGFGGFGGGMSGGGGASGSW